MRRTSWLTVGLLSMSLAAQGGAGGRYPQGKGEPSAREVEVQRAIDAAFGWLVRHQDEDGKWSAALFVRHDGKDAICDGTGKPEQDLMVTSLVALATTGGGSSLGGGRQREVLERATRWLLSQQAEDGFIGPRESSNSVLGHAIATHVLCEANGISNQAEMKEVVRRAAKTIAQLRRDDGGWPRTAGATSSDPEATFWAAVAATSVDLLVRDRKLHIDCGGVPALIEADAKAPRAAGLLIGSFLGNKLNEDAAVAAIADLPRWPEGEQRADFFAWYLGTLVSNQLAAYQMGGDKWQKWCDALLAESLPHQRQDGSFAGSWDPVDVRGKELGRVGATALQLHSLLHVQRMMSVTRRRSATR